MSTFTFVLILGAAVLVSSAINQVVSGVATPLIQIGIGVLLAFAGLTTSNFQVDPELFLVLFIGASALSRGAQHRQGGVVVESQRRSFARRGPWCRYHSLARFHAACP